MRRVEEIAYRDGARLVIFARRPGGRETGTIEFRSLAASSSPFSGASSPACASSGSAIVPTASTLSPFEWQTGGLRPVDLAAFGNIETRLARCLKDEAPSARQLDGVREWLGDLAGRVDVVPATSGNALSLRVLGLEIARLEGQVAPQIYWGLEGNVERLDEGNRQASRDFVAQVLDLRTPETPGPAHEYFRLQSERWLESLLVRDLTTIDPALSPDCIYPQVPAVAGRERGVIDVLGVTRAGRLAVIELKLVEEISLPIQGLDYWLCVRWLLERRQFQAAGYFPGRELADAAPLLYLVSPAFRFHSSTGHLLRYLDPSIEVVQVGINADWRRGIKTLFRRDARVAP